MKTRVVTNEDYANHKMFKIYQVMRDGENDRYPLVSLGKKKLQLIIDNIEEAKAFLEEN